MKQYVLILNGPNLNLTGEREPEIYGTRTLDDILEGLRDQYPDLAFGTLQSNHEGELIDAIHETRHIPECVGIVLNAGAYSHTSLALADAISAVSTPVVEVHMSNVAARGGLRATSLIAPVCVGSITGFGALGYSLAVLALLSRNNLLPLQ